MTQRPESNHDHYHVHVYFGHITVAQTRALCELAGKLFDVTVGRMHEREVGLHPHWSCQLAFDRAEFDPLIPGRTSFGALRRISERLSRNDEPNNLLVAGTKPTI